MEPPDDLDGQQRDAWLLMGPGDKSDGEVAAAVGCSDRTIRNWRAKWRELYGYSGLENRPAAIQEAAEVVAAGWADRRARAALEFGATVEMILGRVQELVPVVGGYEIVDGVVVHLPIDGKDIRELMVAAGVGVDKADQLVGLALVGTQTGGSSTIVGVNVNVVPEDREAIIAQERRHALDRQRAAAAEISTNGNGDRPAEQ